MLELENSGVAAGLKKIHDTFKSLKSLGTGLGNVVQKGEAVIAIPESAESQKKLCWAAKPQQS